MSKSLPNSEKQRVVNSFIEAKMFLEFPLAVISKHAEPGSHSMTFEDEITDKSTGERVTRRITITSGKFGLPIAGDMDVLLALMILTSERNKFHEPTLEFSLSEVLRILRWPDDGRRLKLLKNSLARWLGVTVYFENARRVDGRWISLKGFHLLENVELTNTRDEWDPEVDQYLRWNSKVLDAVKAGFVTMDRDFYFSLKSATAKRLYRFLSKRFEQGAHWQPFNLAHFAVNKVGMRDGQPVSEYKRTMWSAMRELMDKGFLQAEQRGEVFVGRGKHTTVQFKPARRGRTLKNDSVGPSRMVAESATSRIASESNWEKWAFDLKARGVDPSRFLRSKEHKGYNFDLAIEYFDYCRETDSPQGSQNPQGFLAKFISEKWTPPSSYITKAEREEEAQKKKAHKRRRQIEEQRKLEKEAEAEARFQEQDDRAREYLDSLGELEREKLELAAVENASGFMKGLMRKGKESTYYWMVVRDYVLSDVLGDEVADQKDGGEGG